tara:strand:- start:876 stop:1091 length:216 start_codon:yes stop_codon:yes gene_type:complete
MQAHIKNIERQSRTLYNAKWRGNINCLSFCAENLGFRIYGIYNLKGGKADATCENGSLLLERIKQKNKKTK